MPMYHVPLILEPIDWVLYNKLVDVDMREWTELRPSGPGNYMPALDAAERLLSFNPNSSCSLSLMFFSDGRPSDKGAFSERMGKIAAKYGRRLDSRYAVLAWQMTRRKTFRHFKTW